MKLSEAIRLGAMLGPQTCGYEGCAIGAAVAAIGRNWHYTNRHEEKGIRDIALGVWPFLTGKVPNPINSDYPEEVYVVIGALNGWNSMDWSRERIADWVATIEPQEPCESTETEQLQRMPTSVSEHAVHAR